MTRPGDPGAALVVSSTRAAWLATHGNHPNLIRILGVHHVATGPRLMIEHVNARDLASLIDAAYPSRIGLPEALAIVRDLARGLHFLHELRNEKGTAVRLVHGTLSPDLVAVGFDGIARVAGLERVAATRGAPRPLPEFGAPEQFEDGAAVDRRADVFALTAILLRAATGLFVVGGAIPTPTSQAVPHVPQSVEDLLRRGLSREPGKRYATAEDLRAAIEGVVVRDGLHAAPDRVALMVSRLMPELGPGAAPLPPRPDQSMWASGQAGAPRWLASESVLDHSPPSSVSGFDAVSVQVPRAQVRVPSPLVPAAAPAAPTMAVDALVEPGAPRRPSRPPLGNPPVPQQAGTQLPLHLAPAVPPHAMPPQAPPAPHAPSPPPPDAAHFAQLTPIATELVRLPDQPRRRPVTSDPIFLIGGALVLFFAALLVAYFASG